MLPLKNKTVGLSSVVKPTILIHLKSKITMRYDITIQSVPTRSALGNWTESVQFPL